MVLSTNIRSLQVQLDETQNMMLERKSKDEQSSIMTLKILVEKYNLMDLGDSGIILPIPSFDIFMRFEDAFYGP